MELFSFDGQSACRVTAFDSDFLAQPVVRSGGKSQTSLMTLKKNGVISRHRATVPQLLIVLSGAGFVSGDAAEPVPVREGMAVFWAEGEWHETRTDSGLTAVVIEGESLVPEDVLMERVRIRK